MRVLNTYNRKPKRLGKARRDYHIKNLNNPFYFRADRGSIIRKVNLLLLVMIVFGLYYMAQFTNYFKLTDINVDGGGQITKNLIIELTQQQAQERRFILFTQDKLPFFNKHQLQQTIEQQVVLNDLKIDKDYRHGLHISFTERQSEYYLMNQGQFFTLDAQGNLISVLSEIPASSTLPVLSYQEKNLTIGMALTDSDYLAQIADLQQNWPIEGFRISRFEITADYGKEIQFVTDKGFTVYLSRQYDLQTQLSNLQQLYQDSIADKKAVEYIDLRLEGWIYYK